MKENRENSLPRTEGILFHFLLTKFLFYFALISLTQKNLKHRSYACQKGPQKSVSISEPRGLLAPLLGMSKGTSLNKFYTYILHSVGVIRLIEVSWIIFLDIEVSHFWSLRTVTVTVSK